MVLPNWHSPYHSNQVRTKSDLIDLQNHLRAVLSVEDNCMATIRHTMTALPAVNTRTALNGVLSGGAGSDVMLSLGRVNPMLSGGELDGIDLIVEPGSGTTWPGRIEILASVAGRKLKPISVSGIVFNTDAATGNIVSCKAMGSNASSNTNLKGSGINSFIKNDQGTWSVAADRYGDKSELVRTSDGKLRCFNPLGGCASPVVATDVSAVISDGCYGPGRSDHLEPCRGRNSKGIYILKNNGDLTFQCTGSNGGICVTGTESHIVQAGVVDARVIETPGGCASSSTTESGTTCHDYAPGNQYFNIELEDGSIYNVGGGHDTGGFTTFSDRYKKRSSNTVY